MKRFRVKSEIAEDGTEKHYPQKSFLLIFWSCYSLESLGPETLAILNDDAYSLYGRKFWKEMYSFESWNHDSKIYFSTFGSAHHFIEAVERDIPKRLLLASLKEVKSAKPKKTVITRNVNLY